MARPSLLGKDQNLNRLACGKSVMVGGYAKTKAGHRILRVAGKGFGLERFVKRSTKRNGRWNKQKSGATGVLLWGCLDPVGKKKNSKGATGKK